MAALLLLLSGCSDGTDRTLAGASDLVRVDFRSVPFSGLPSPVAEVCLDNACRPRQPVVGSQVFVAGGEDFLGQRPTKIDVKVYSAERLVRQGVTTVQPEEFAPNGKDCGPVVSQVHLRYGADNTIEQRPVNEQ